LLPFEAFFQAIAIPLAVHDMGAVRQSIKKSCRHHRIAEYLGPVGKTKIRGNNYRSFLLPFCKNLKQQFPAFFGKRDVAQLIELCGAPHKSIYVECSFMWRNSCGTE
jgi:hypothetical protein